MTITSHAKLGISKRPSVVAAPIRHHLSCKFMPKAAPEVLPQPSITSTSPQWTPPLCKTRSTPRSPSYPFRVLREMSTRLSLL